MRLRKVKRVALNVRRGVDERGRGGDDIDEGNERDDELRCE